MLKRANNVSGANAAGCFAFRMVRVTLWFASGGRQFPRRIAHSNRSANSDV
jgi:hypothetical protein